MGKKQVRVVFDTNIYISFFLTRGETIASLFSHWENGDFTVLASPSIIEEVKKSFQYPKIRKRLKARDIFNLYLLLENEVEAVYPESKVKLLQDPKDNMYLVCAKDGKADYLVTGDKKHLLPLKKFGKTKITSPKEFVEILKGKSTNTG